MNSAATSVAARAAERPTLATLWRAGRPTQAQGAALAALRRQVAWPLLLTAGLLGAWTAWAPLSGAVVVAGQVQTELGRKLVQHQEGGIVRALNVRAGDRVRRGDPLLVVGDVRSDATLDLLHKQLDAERLRAARARAELALAPAVDWPDAGAAPDARQREAELFAARRQALTEQLAALQRQQRDAQSRVGALEAQVASSLRAAELARDELRIHQPLAESGFIQKTRLISLERNVADLSGRADAARGEIAEARMQAGALASTAAQARSQYQQRAADDLKDASARLRELDDRLRPSQDLVERQVVRAPVDGTVLALRVSAPGTAVGPREPLLEIVPADEGLVVDVRLDPHDIDHVQVGGAAEVRFAAFDARTTPMLPARVTRVAPDATTDPTTRQTGYVAQVTVDAAELGRHPRLRLQAGMPAEVFVGTPARSLLEYLLEPIGLFARRAMREP